jgi:hypothetical protein
MFFFDIVRDQDIWCKISRNIVATPRTYVNGSPGDYGFPRFSNLNFYHHSPLKSVGFAVVVVVGANNKINYDDVILFSKNGNNENWLRTRSKASRRGTAVNRCLLCCLQSFRPRRMHLLCVGTTPGSKIDAVPKTSWNVTRKRTIRSVYYNHNSYETTLVANRKKKN